MNANGDSSSFSAVKSADRALDILEFCAQRREPVAHAELAAELGIPKSSVSALLSNLVDRNYLIFDRYTRGYALGAAVVLLSNSYLREIDLARIGQEVTQALASEFSESVALAVSAGPRVLVLARHNWVQPLMYSVDIGDTVPVHASATGKAILAHATAQRRTAMLAGKRLKPVTPATITSRKTLDRELMQIRLAGVAFAREELVTGIVTVAAPVFDASGEVKAALGVIVPTPRIRPESLDRVTERIRKAADGISQRLGAPVQSQAAAGRIKRHAIK